MKNLKEKLSEMGHGFEAPDIDVNQLSGMRRLHVLHARARKADDKGGKLVVTSAQQPEDTARSLKPVASEQSVPAVTVPADRTESKVTEAAVVPRVLAEGGEGLFGLSRTASILIFAGGVVFIILLSYVIYKYMSWKPKMVARRGYRAISKSKGLDVTDSDVGAVDSPTTSPINSSRPIAPNLIVAKT